MTNNMENNKKTDKEYCEEMRGKLTPVLGVKPESFVCLGTAEGRVYGGIDGDMDELADALVMAMDENADVDWVIWTACERSGYKKEPKG
jgi:hypothetical protein